MNSFNFVDLKIAAVEAVKDSPIFLYAAFYDPFHSWLYDFANEMNPIIQFVLNCIALGYGLYRIYSIYKRWKEGDVDDNNTQHKLF
jgi:hypothetical protein